MNKRILTTLVVLGLGTNSVFAKNIVNLKITNITSTKGEIHIGLYKKGQKFPVHEARHYKKVIKPKIGTMKVTIKNLPNNQYAIAVLHDTNSNDHLDTNFLGMPKEPFGFSKNYKPTLSAPKFTDCSFRLKNETKNVVIHLID